jgi:hypothetical protein
MSDWQFRMRMKQRGDGWRLLFIVVGNSDTGILVFLD